MQDLISAIEMRMNDIHDEVASSKNNMAPTWSEIVGKAVDCKFEKASVKLNKVEKSIEDMRKKTLEIKDKEDLAV